MSAPVTGVAAICRGVDSAWSATCALLDHAEVAGVRSSVWDDDDARRGAAESVRASLERVLYPPGGANARVGSVYDPKSAGQAIAASATTLNVGELSHVAAFVLDQVYWPSFTRDWDFPRDSLPLIRWLLQS